MYRNMYSVLYHYFKILVVCRPSVKGGHWKQFDPETQGIVSLVVE